MNVQVHWGSDPIRWLFQQYSKLFFQIINCSKMKGDGSGRYDLFKPIFSVVPLSYDCTSKRGMLS